MTSNHTAILFGAYRLVPSERALFEGGQPVRLSGRAFDLLLALLERPGEVLSKDELIARVWPSTCVEEGNLRVHIGALRRALRDASGSQYVENVVGRGYSFVAPVRRVAQDAGGAAERPAHPPGVQAGPQPEPQPVAHPAPASISPFRIIGRDDTLRHLAVQVPQRRLITLAGPGGIGKTTVALAAAEALAPGFAHGAILVDLAPLTGGAQVTSALALALGMPAMSSDPLSTLVAHLHAMHVLLVLDNCEHLIDSVAALAERLLRQAPRVHMLATSREPLRADAEWVHRLPPLALPPVPSGHGTAALALLAATPAVQLFVERATACMDSFRLHEDNAAAVADICRRLDGIPLAIELAAGRAEFFGVHGLAARLEDCFTVLKRGRRTALPRHQTLRATLDWSYDMLGAAEQAVLRRCAIFRAPFTLDCAADVAQSGGISAEEVLDCIANLAAKSLLSADGGAAQFRLLGTTRAYALDKLRASGELAVVARRYAQRCRDFLRPAQAELERQPLQAWLATYGRSIDHVRAVLDWTLNADGAEGDLALGLELCALSGPLWYQLSLMDEYRSRLQQALELARQAGADALAPQLEMPLALALGHALLHTGDQADNAARTQAFARALELAQQTGDNASRMGALWGCYIDAIFNGDYQLALGYAERFGVAAAGAGGELHQLAHARMLARTMHYLGHQDRARRHIEFVARHPLDRARLSHGRGFQLDQHISTMAIHSRVLWLQGQPEQAMEVARACVETGLQAGHGISLCFAVLAGCTIFTWCGDEAEGQRCTGLMLDHAQRCALPQWHFWGEGYAMAQRLLHGQPPGEKEVFVLQQDRHCGNLQVDVLATLHPRLLTARAIARAEAGCAGWSRAEVMRCQGEALFRAGAVEQAGQLFTLALAIAAEQGALAWELRAATSLAHLRSAQGRRQEARAQLEGIYSRYTEGHATRDLQTARALLDELARPN
ncbi:ATP-binding protein [Pseudoduganella aquatica]|uniref:AAA family ATPase n=1 Tax=Pseudoduganella aquatica TaxID=2660641 RepID=A0A7X4KPP9_9BURK|nr:winged helix-turn-helix domain-containing protein [Pseudoduganella aquatica]MYN10407.1 AAA family ATPase [Pseudoduganella aquatica]